MKKHSARLHLKQMTEKAHREAEQSGLMKPLMGAHVSNEDFLQALNGLYSWLERYEMCLQTWLPKDNQRLFEYYYQPRSGQILADIHALGGFTPPPNIHHVNAVSIYQALGYAYVIEGSTQGGRMLSQRLNKVLNLEGNALSYFNFYRYRSWQRFIEMFECFSFTNEQLNEMTSAAVNAFASLNSIAQRIEQRDSTVAVG